MDTKWILALLGAFILAVAAGCDGTAADDDDAAGDDDDDTTAGDDDDATPGDDDDTTPGDDDDDTTAGDDDDDATPTIWAPAPGTTWQWQLQGNLDTSHDVQMYDVDLFDTAQAAIDGLHADGRIVICYFSAGSYEDWRDDAGDFPAEALGHPLGGWPGEYWLDVTHPTVRSIMEARLDVAAAKACDGVEPDNVDGYANDNGHGLSAADQRDYNQFLADAAHARGLSVGLKNDLDQVAQLEPWFDWALNEECMSYSECGALAPFLDAGKAVFHVEYVDHQGQGSALAAQVCGDPAIDGFSTLIKTWDLDSWVIACP